MQPWFSADIISKRNEVSAKTMTKHTIENVYPVAGSGFTNPQETDDMQSALMIIKLMLLVNGQMKHEYVGIH